VVVVESGKWTGIVESPLPVVIQPVFTGTQAGLKFTECATTLERSVLML
jgi:hypothetical protein